MSSIASNANGRYNNFDIIRFIAASLVIFSHSYPITLGNNESEPLYIISNEQITLGTLGVFIFFSISGFLITKSYDKNKNIFSFIKNRLLRIFPGLFVVIMLSIFILGPIVTNLSTREYFKDFDAYNYLLSIFLYPMQYDLPGVFLDNPHASAVNGSLWSLPIEFTFYFVILFLGVAKLLKRKLILGLFVFSLVLPYLNIPVGENYIDLFRFFIAGSFVYLYREKIPLDWRLAIVSLILIFISLLYGQFNTVFAICGTYLIFYCSFNQNIKLYNFSKHGDASYGMYIYAFPVQQLIVYYFEYMPPLQNFLIAFPITAFLAYCSWHWIEKPSMKLKNKNFFIFSKYKKDSTHHAA